MSLAGLTSSLSCINLEVGVGFEPTLAKSYRPVSALLDYPTIIFKMCSLSTLWLIRGTRLGTSLVAPRAHFKDWASLRLQLAVIALVPVPIRLRIPRR